MGQRKKTYSNDINEVDHFVKFSAGMKDREVFDCIRFETFQIEK
jgi:hypothetical protein